MAADSKGTGNLDKELEALYQPKAVQKQKRVRVSGSKAAGVRRAQAKKEVIMTKGKRKRAVARASLTQGSGIVLINGVDVNKIMPDILRELMLEPARISQQAASIMNNSDISVNVYGGGRSGQAQAVRSAIAKALSAAAGTPALRQAYMAYDRTLIVDDYRRVEPKKFLGTKARARFQKSYR